jgi:hypothetical protein
MKPENVIGVLVYGDQHGHWWGDVVLENKKSGKTVNVGTVDREPAHSQDEAMKQVEGVIAMIKAAREDPIVQQCRDLGIDPDSLLLLRVKATVEGNDSYRWVLMTKTQCEREALNFFNANFLKGTAPLQSDREAAQFCKENKMAPGLESLERARQAVFEHAAELPINPRAILLSGTIEVYNWPAPAFQAAAYLLRNGVENIDDRDIAIPPTDIPHIVPPIIHELLPGEQLLAPQSDRTIH